MTETMDSARTAGSLSPSPNLELPSISSSPKNVKDEDHEQRKRKLHVKPEPLSITDEEFEQDTHEPQRKRRKKHAHAHASKDHNINNHNQPATSTATSSTADREVPIEATGPAPPPQNPLNAMMYNQQCYVPVVPHYVYQHPQPPGHPINIPNLSPYNMGYPGMASGPMPPPHAHQFFGQHPMMNVMNPMSMQRAAAMGAAGPKPPNNVKTLKSLKTEELDAVSMGSASNSGGSTASPFRTTYISKAEELELKNTNRTLFEQFHCARTAIHRQFQQKVESVRCHSGHPIDADKLRLTIKMAAVDAKVQEKKLFMSYLEMSKPQPNSWLVANGPLAQNGFAQKICHQQETPASYKPNTVPTNSNSAAHNAQGSEAAKENKAKRVKKPKFSEFNVRVLRDWYETHTANPYPSASEKRLMCRLTGLTKYQVSRWFCNVRTRKPPPELSDEDEDINSAASHSSGSRGSRGRRRFAHAPPPMMMHPPMGAPMGMGMPNMYCGLSPINLTMAHALPPMTPLGNGPISVNSSHSGRFNFGRIDNASNDGIMPQISSIFNAKQQQKMQVKGQAKTEVNGAETLKAELKAPPLTEQKCDDVPAQK